MEEKTNTRSGGSRSDELDDFGFENVEWLALHSGVPIEVLETLTAYLVEQVEEQTGRPPEGIPDPRALRTGLRRRSTDGPAEEEVKEPSSADPPSPPPPPSEPAPSPRPATDGPFPQPPLGDPPPPPTSPPNSLSDDVSPAADDDPPQPKDSDTEGAGARGESGAPTEEDHGGSAPGREAPPPDGGGSAPPAEPANPKQAEIEEAWDKSGIPITKTAKEFAGEKGVWPGETETGRGREVDGVKQITQRDVRDAYGRKSKEKRKKEKEEAQDRALQQNRGASGEAEPPGPSGEAEEPETAPRSDEEAGEAGRESPTEAEGPEAAALEPSALREGDDDDLPGGSAEEHEVGSRPPYMGLFEDEPDN